MWCSIKFAFWLTQCFGEIYFMNISNVRRHAALVFVTLSLSLFICLLAISAKVPIRVTLTPLSTTVEINPDKSPSCFIPQDVTERLIASDGEGKTASDSPHPQYARK